jgi:hypothetical protein
MDALGFTGACFTSGRLPAWHDGIPGDRLAFSPVSVYWLDYLATNRTCALDSLPRFNLMPARLPQRLGYLQARPSRRDLLRSLPRTFLRRK